MTRVKGNAPSPTITSRLDDPDPNFSLDPDAPSGSFVVSFNDGRSDDDLDEAGTPPPLKSGASTQQTAIDEDSSVFTSVRDEDWTNPDDPVTNPHGVATAQSIVSTYGGTLRFVGDEVGAFAVDGLSEAQARAMSHDPRVYAVDSDTVGHISTTSQYTPYGPYGGLWALDSLDQRNKRPRNNAFTYTSSGMDVHVYVMDSGIMVTHPEIQGRASLDYSAVNGESPDGRYDSHGTSVASIIGGVNVGVAKDVKLHSVKVLNKHDDVYYSTMIRACNWVKKHGKQPAVVNCSFGARYGWSPGRPSHSAVQHAFERLLSAGFAVVASAGNEHDNADHYLPSGVGKAITVGALTYTPDSDSDSPTSYSNYGSALDIYAPGDFVKAASFSGKGDQRSANYDPTFNGTSASAPLVSGVVAQYLQNNPTAKPASIATWLKNISTKGRVTGLRNSSPDRILFTNL